MISPDDFVRDGYLRVPGAFSGEVAAQCRDLLWAQIDASPDDASTWTEPVVRVGYQDGGPFEEAANTPSLRAAYDALVGEGRWMPRTNIGTFPIRFPSDDHPNDDGWHIDSSFPPLPADDQNDPFKWRVNLASRGRALLMLFLLSDTSENDAPTRLRVGSHLDVARILAPCGDEGLTMIEASERGARMSSGREVVLATGNAGDVYLCHPFLVHAAQTHRGSTPRFLAQPPLHPVGWVNGSFDAVSGTSPVELAIRKALDGATAP